MFFGEMGVDVDAPKVDIDDSEGSVVVHPTAEFGVDCHLVGPVTIDEGAVISDGSVIEASTIGAFAFVGLGVTVVRSIVGTGAAIQDGTPGVHDMFIGDHRGLGCKLIAGEPGEAPNAVLCGSFREAASQGKAPDVAAVRKQPFLIE